MILASQSPRRRELLSEITKDFRVIPAAGEEIVPENTPPEKAVQMLAEQKADEISRKYPGELILAADTVVAADGKILGKPRGEDDAFRMLKMLSGRVHSVFTGVCLIYEDGSKRVFCERADVEFREISDDEIHWYIATGEPMDKAGAYGIQGKAERFVKRLDGDITTVIGLPVSAVKQALR